MKQKWYLQTWFICLLFAFWMFVIPGIAGLILLIMQIVTNAKQAKDTSILESSLDIVSEEKQKFEEQVHILSNQLQELVHYCINF